MATGGLASGLMVTAALAAMPLLILPTRYYFPEFWLASEGTLATVYEKPEPPPTPHSFWPDLDLQLTSQPTLDLFCTALLLVFAFFVYFCEWIQRKLMERRIVKLNQYLGTSVERLRSWDAQQEQLESTLRVVQTATLEYNLLYLLLRQKRSLAYGGSRKATLF